MKLKIVIYYDKDKKDLDNYIIKRVIIKSDENYTIRRYYMVDCVIKEYCSKFKMNEPCFNKYLKRCKKSEFYNRTEYEFITWER